MLKEEEFVIIGAGVAGLCAANRLTDLGKHALVIEGGDYPSPKVCGEFISPECLGSLQKWDIVPPIRIHEAHFYAGRDHLHFSLPIPAASMPHMQRDQQLLDYAINKGVTVLTRTKVIELRHESQGYELHLSNGDALRTQRLLIGTGRLPQFHPSPPPLLYAGIKNHLAGIQLQNRIEMYSFPGAYMGLVAIEEDIANMVCLVERAQLELAGTAEKLMHTLSKSYPQVQRYLEEGEYGYPEWLTCYIPRFGPKMPAPRPHTYFIGDAAGSIPPITGDGVAMAVSSGVMAADFAFRDDVHGYCKQWLKTYKKQIRWGQFLHRLMLHPLQSKIAMKLCFYLPKLSEQLYMRTRDLNYRK